MSSETLRITKAIVVKELRGKVAGPRELSTASPELRQVKLSELSVYTQAILTEVEKGKLQMAVDVYGNVVVVPRW